MPDEHPQGGLTPPAASSLDAANAEIQRLKRKLERERATRIQAESIAEKGLRELYDRQRQVELMEKIATASNQTSSVMDTLKFAVEQICEFTTWSIGHSYIVIGKGADRRLRSTGLWHQLGQTDVEKFRRISEQSEFEDGIGLPGRAMSTGKPVWVDDVTDDTNFPRRLIAEACGLRGASAFPVFSGDRVVAVLEFFTEIAREPESSLLELMVQIGQQLGRVIERQKSDDDLRERALQLMRARDDAKAADRAKSAFLASMSHELRTPLNAIIGFSEVLKSQLFGPIENKRYRAYHEDIYNSGNHLLSLINDVLDITKADAGQLVLHEERVNIPAVIAECLHMVEPQARKGSVALRVAKIELYELRADARRIRQILLNLLSNAVKFTPDGGTVTVSSGLSDGGLAICVADTGIGMKAEDIPRALERFGQIDNALSRKYEGTGLGLPLSKQLIELHDGKLLIESALGVGTVASAIFPASRVSMSRAA